MPHSEGKTVKFIGITTEGVLPHEARLIAVLLDNGLYRLHLRKPAFTKEETEALLQTIDSRYYDRIVVHDHFELAVKYRLAGVHLNRRNPVPPAITGNYTPALSRSCHSIEELSHNEGYAYQFLSPIFDSISKSGYRSAFTPKELTEAAEKGIIGEQVIALGGIIPERIADLKTWHFGGAALLGFLWQNPTEAGVIERLDQIRNI